ncbi:MAG: hypothetical protein KKD77_21395 [Gammaproteobacteria bacterium]|nr:hypothetical protein [Gammaproteobacteria bacterium]
MRRILLILSILYLTWFTYDYFAYKNYRKLVKEIESGKSTIIVDYPVRFKGAITVPKNVTIYIYSPDLLKPRTFIF